MMTIATLAMLATAAPPPVIAPDYVGITTTVATRTRVPPIEVPQAVSVVTRDQIDLRAAIDAAGALRYVAGVGGTGGAYDPLTVRGFVPVRYLDGVPLADGLPAIDLYGFSAVDLLKGPGSALYGAGSPGGLLALTSRRPAATFGGEAMVKAGGGFRQVAGTVTGPVVRGVRAAATALARTQRLGGVRARRSYAAPAVAVDLGPATVLTAIAHRQHDRITETAAAPDAGRYRSRQSSAGYELVHDASKDMRVVQTVRWSRYRAEARGLEPAQAGRGAQVALHGRVEATRWTGPVQHNLLVGIDHRRGSGGFAAAGAAPGARAGARFRQTGAFVGDQIKLNTVVLTLAGRQDRTRVRGPTAPAAPSRDRFSYRLGASYATAAGIAPYLGRATAFEPLPIRARDGQALASGVAHQWEAGVKYDARGLPPDVQLFATVAAYRLRQRAATVTGVEFELAMRIRDRLSVNAAYGGGGARGGGQSAAAFVDWSFRDGPLAGLGIGGGVRHRSRGWEAGRDAGWFAGDVRGGDTGRRRAQIDAVLRYDRDGWRVSLDTVVAQGRMRCVDPVACALRDARPLTATLTRRF